MLRLSFIFVLIGCVPSEGTVADVRGETAIEDVADVADLPDVGPGVCVLAPQPSRIDIYDIGTGAGTTALVELFSIGTGTCLVTALEITGHAGFTSAPTPLPIEIRAGDSHVLAVIYTNTQPGPAHAELTITTSSSGPIVVPLDADVGSACVEVLPGEITFGESQFGSVATIDGVIRSCGARPLVIHRIVLDGDPDFVLGGLPELPAVLQPNEALTLQVMFVPSEPGNRTADLIVESNSVDGTQHIPVRGSARIECCGTDFSCVEGAVVIAGSFLHCEASHVDCSGERFWDATGPLPLPTIIGDARPHASIQFHEPGTYGLTLASILEGGVCDETVRTITVVPPADLTVFLTLEGHGAVVPDVGLHLRHENASGWFDDTWDAWASGGAREWGAPGAADDPVVSDALVTLSRPEGRYTVGVHYAGLVSTGNVLANVRVHLAGALVFEDRAMLVPADLWEVVHIDWPDAFTPIEPRSILHDFVIR